MSEQQPRKIRKGSSRLVGGVCSGLAEYFGIDPWLVRIVFIVLIVTPAGMGLLIYLLLWLLMPEQPQPDATLGGTIRTGANSMASDVRRIAGELRPGRREPQ